MNYTSNYQLNQWAKSDQVRMEDFNADNAKIDAALAGKGNCKIVTGSYTGNGTYGQSNPTTLTFPFQPLLVMVAGPRGSAVMVAGAGEFGVQFSRTIVVWKLAWSGNTLSWYITQANIPDGGGLNLSAEGQLNESGTVYHYVAIGATDG